MDKTYYVKPDSSSMFKNNVEIKIKQIRQIKSISGLLDYISDRGLAKASAVLLYIWILAPLVAIIVNLLSNNLVNLESSAFMPGQKALYIILLQTGYLGCLIGLAVFIKSIYNAKQTAVRFKDYVKKHIVQILLFLMLLWSIMSCLLSEDFNRSFYGTFYRKDGLLTYFAYCGIFCCGYAVRTTKHVRSLLYVFAAAAVILSAFALKDSRMIDLALGLSRNAAIFLNTNHFGYYICLAIMCTGMLFITEKGVFRKSIFIVFFAVMVAALIKNDSFGPYLAVSVGLLSLLILTLWLKRQYLKWVLAAVGVFAVASILMTLIGYPVFNEFGKMTSDMGDIIKNTDDAATAGSYRWELWVNGSRFITEKPLFGYGPENLGEQYGPVLKYFSDRPHNEIIQFAASLGIPAAVFYISALTAHFVKYIKMRKQVSMVTIGICCALVAYLVSSMVGNTMYYTTPYFFMILGFSILNKPEGELLQSSL